MPALANGEPKNAIKVEKGVERALSSKPAALVLARLPTATEAGRANDGDGPKLWRFKRIMGRRRQNGHWQVAIQWETGETTWEWLTQIKRYASRALALYAREQGIQDVRGWRWSKQFCISTGESGRKGTSQEHGARSSRLFSNGADISTGQDRGAQTTNLSGLSSDGATLSTSQEHVARANVNNGANNGKRRAEPLLRRQVRARQDHGAMHASNSEENDPLMEIILCNIFQHQTLNGEDVHEHLGSIDLPSQDSKFSAARTAVQDQLMPEDLPGDAGEWKFSLPNRGRVTPRQEEQWTMANVHRWYLGELGDGTVQSPSTCISSMRTIPSNRRGPF